MPENAAGLFNFEVQLIYLPRSAAVLFTLEVYLYLPDDVQLFHYLLPERCSRTDDVIDRG